MTSCALSIDTLLKPYLTQIENAINANIEALGTDHLLKKACLYSLLNGGKRIRPALVLIIGEAIGAGADISQAALAIEYFHTASLVVDDLPCMDDDDERRNHPCTHKIYGETMTLLVSYALIAEGYRCLSQNAELLRKGQWPHSKDSDRICTLALDNAGYNTGLQGATGGQYLDIFPPDLSLETVKEVIHKKTTSLFEISFVFGWLYGGGDINKLDSVKKAASHFGMAFQIADDLGDMLQDAANERKINMATLFGKEEALQLFLHEINNFEQEAALLGILTPQIDGIIRLLKEQALESYAFIA